MAGQGLLWVLQFPICLLSLLVILNSSPYTSGDLNLKKVDPKLIKKIDSAPKGSTWNIIVAFKKDPNLQNSRFSDVEEAQEQAYQMVEKMKKNAEESQHGVIQGLNKVATGTSGGGNKKKMFVDTLWLTNDLYIRHAWKELIYDLADVGKPENENITHIVEVIVFTLDKGKDENNHLQGVGRSGGPERFKEAWGLEKINAQAWWDAGFTGAGVIVGHIDDGVDVRHPSLKWNWVGKPEGWWDPEAPNNTFPYASDKETSHGTHTLGIIVGRGRGSSNKNESDVDFRGVGVAPGARWTSCAACREKKPDGSVGCDGYHVLKCGAFIYCPNDKARCRYRPNVVSVSMGCTQDETEECASKFYYPYDGMLAKFHSGKIIPVYAAGNNGKKGCGSVNDPADSEDVITVGNVDIHDMLDIDSGKGPIVWRYNDSYTESRGIFKPDLVAPGVKVISTVYTGRSGEFAFGFKTGTSQATPHVAGAIALLLSRTANMTFQQVREILFKFAVRNVALSSTNPKLQCGRDKADRDQPNHKFGNGRLFLPNPDDRGLPAVDRPTRLMPPPPDFSDLPDDSTPPSVRPGMVGVVIMASVAFFMNPALEI